MAISEDKFAELDRTNSRWCKGRLVNGDYMPSMSVKNHPSTNRTYVDTPKPILLTITEIRDAQQTINKY